MPSSYKLRLRATPSGSTELSQDGATYLAVLRLVQDRTSLHNIVFLEGVKAALTARAAWNHGWYDGQPAKGLRSMARVYAGWGFSQAFYWNECYREVGFSSLEDFLAGLWEGFFLEGLSPKIQNNPS